ncbi:MAG: hypothetical protein AAGC46_20970, partial [Solirubrobacteraceae bacterium]
MSSSTGRAPRRSRRLALATTIGAAALIAAPVAQAAAPTDLEVISRATGVAGAAPANGATLSGVVSPDGRTAVYTSIDGAELTNPQAPFRLMVRDIVSNTTLQVTSSG